MASFCSYDACISIPQPVKLYMKHTQIFGSRELTFQSMRQITVIKIAYIFVSPHFLPIQFCMTCFTMQLIQLRIGCVPATMSIRETMAINCIPVWKSKGVPNIPYKQRLRSGHECVWEYYSLVLISVPVSLAHTWLK